MTLVQRQLFWVSGASLYTLTLTALPFRDPEASAIFARMRSSLHITNGAEQNA